MADLRNRVSITLTNAEFEQVKALAQILGIKPTRVVYEALKEGMPLILSKGQKFSNDVAFASNVWSQSSWVEPEEKKKQRGGKKKR